MVVLLRPFASSLFSSCLVQVLGILPQPSAIASVAVQQSTTAVTWSSTTVSPSTGLPPTHTPSGGLLLSPASEVIPHKLVEKIRSGKFVAMKELLQDNIALLDQLESLQGPSSVQVIGATRPRLREVTSLPTWCYCFLGFVATMTADPITRDQLAYARIIIKEAQRQGGLGWLDYDKAFRQQMATDPSIPWNIINPSLMASTTLGQRSSGQGMFCSLCRAVDHTRAQCALTFLEPQRYAPQVGRKPRICLSWNRGNCTYAGRCNYKHVCSSCMAATHKAPECSQAKTTSAVPSPRQL